MGQSIFLPESLKCYDRPDFRAVLIDELGQNVHELPLEDFLNFGGLPDTESLKISFVKDVRHEGEVRVTVRCAFDEMVPTGCCNLPWKEPAIGDFDVVLDIEHSLAYLDD